MRQIKFRGKRIDNGEWVYGSLVNKSPDEAFILIGVTAHIKRDDYECYMIEVDPATVGQFTGLPDKNGKEIYEGDKTKRGYVIMWSEEKALFCEHIYYDVLSKWSPASYPIDPSGIEIIGNIHETI